MREDPPTLLASLVASDERTQEEIVAGYERCARDRGEDASLSLRTLRRWMLGDVQTMPRPAQRRVARAYWGHSMDELLAPASGDSPGPPAVTDDDSPAVVVATPTEVVTTSRQHPSPPDPGDASLERQVAMSAKRAARFTSYAETRNAGPEAIEQLHSQLGDLAAAYIRAPLASIMADLVQMQDAVFTLLEGRQRAADRVELYTLASLASGLLAKASHDLARPQHALTQARTMYVCADNADHNGLRVWSRGLQSLIAYWDGRPQEAVRYAQTGASIARADMRGTVTAWLPALEARALARLGRADEARRALQRAQDQRHAWQPDALDRLGGLLTFPLAKQHYYAAGAHVSLPGGEAEGADAAAAALALYQDGDASEQSFSDIAGARAELALARVHSGALDGAREALAPVLDLDPDRRIGGIVTSANRVHQALCDSPYADSDLAVDLRDEIESFRKSPASALVT